MMGLATTDLTEWLIPAHAGKTKHIAYLKRSTRAHPRSRGENSLT